MKKTEHQKIGLYIHVPYCRHKCAYCDFYSTDKGTDAERVAQMKQYEKAVRHHMRLVSAKTSELDVDSVFIGGGTPTALPPKLLLSLIAEVRDSFYETEDMEFTVEMNPATADEQLLRKMRRAGVNRLSIGLQSSQAKELAALSRIHTFEEFEASFDMARLAGFDNINVDLMYGIPGQTRASLSETLRDVIALNPEHISLYNLILEEGTPLYTRRATLDLPDENTEYQMYESAIRQLAAEGYEQYEISNFAKPGYECRHNLRYWNCGEYIGFGPAAHSYFAGRRFSIKPSVTAYIEGMQKKEKTLPASLLDENTVIDRKESVIEYIMLQFRLLSGLDCAAFKARFGADFEAVFGKRCLPYIQNGFMTKENGRYAFTTKGLYVSNYILSSLLPLGEKGNQPSRTKEKGLRFS